MRLRTKPRNRKYKNKLANREDFDSHKNIKVMEVDEKGNITLADAK